MFGNDLYTIEIETTWNTVKTKRRLLVPAQSREQAHFKVSAYLMDLNWPVVGEYLEDKRQWYISDPLEEVDLIKLMSSPGAVRLGSDVSFPNVNIAKQVKPITAEESLAFKQEDDIDPDVEDDPCHDCLEVSCFTCLFAYDDDWWGAW